ncbi:MAG: prolyl oligopeptidase family serine peptidase, partial [Acidobacteria bacterium]|nr:prolyl oligopeptidase family serine peptidase [Acidobacteriota bacterium]
AAKDGAMKPLIEVAEADFKLLGSQGSRFWFYTDWNAPRGRIIAFDLERPQPRHWMEVVPQAQEPISGRSNVGGNALGMFGKHLVLVYLKDGRPFLRTFDLQGKLKKEAAFPTGGSVWGGFSGRQDDPEVFYRFLELTSPSTIYRLNPATGRSEVFLRSTVNLRPGDYVVKHVFFRSKDGTRVPMFLAHKHGAEPGKDTPALLYGYGAFGWVAFTWFQPQVLAWMEMGGVFALPAIRGGGEYGEDWHKAGMKLNKQNAIDDYIAAAEWLVANGYTSSSRLVANGGSASGPVAAAAVLQRPGLFGASVIDRPILDLLRFDQFTAASYWIPEFGSASDPQEFKALYAYSPYHTLRDGQCYPPTLVVSGERDQTAVPLHAYKFTAAMQAAQGCGQPVLLKVMRGIGHNFGATAEQRVDSWTDILTFLFRALGMDAAQRKPPQPGAPGI